MNYSPLLRTPSEVGNQTKPPASEETAELTSFPQPGSRTAKPTFESHYSQNTDIVAESDPSHVSLHTDCNLPAFQHNAVLLPVNTSTPQAHPSITTHRASPSADLRVQTDLWNSKDYKGSASGPNTNASEIHPRHTPSSIGLPVRTSSVRSALAAANYTGGSLSPASAVSSPGLGPLADMTPLPSPIGLASPPGAWKTMATSSSTSIPGPDSKPVVIDQQHESPSYGRGTPKKRKAYQGLISTPPAAPTVDPQTMEANAASHARNRTLSEYVPTSARVPRTRYNAVSGSKTPMTIEPVIPKSMYREEYLAVQRGISALQPPQPPTPPPSNRSATGSIDLESPPTSPRPNKGALPLRYEAQDVKTGMLKRWSAIRQLGKGTFSTVMLASKEDQNDANHILKAEEELNPKSLVAVKICEHGPAGGADEKKIESSLKRELDILKAIDHPSLVHLKAVSILEKRAFLVLNYSAGGDLFELASLQLDLLVPSLIRRIFAELVAAVRYLHSQYIVHRDIKLESMMCSRHKPRNMFLAQKQANLRLEQTSLSTSGPPPSPQSPTGKFTPLPS